MNDYVARPPIVVKHDGGMRFTANVRGHQIVTDQPERAGGTDSGPMPLELLGASLGTCIALYVQQFCEVRDLPFAGMRVEVFQQTDRNPSRVAQFSVRVIMPEELPEQYVAMLDKVVQSCPAHYTLAHETEITVNVVMPAAQTVA